MPNGHPRKPLTRREWALGALLWGTFIVIGIGALYGMDVLVGG
jgi:hypothetical protein